MATRGISGKPPSMPDGLRPVYFAAAGLCAVMIVANLFLVRKRGNSALALAGAFATMSLLLLTQTDPEYAPYSPYFAGVTIALLIVDAVLRITHKSTQGPS